MGYGSIKEYEALGYCTDRKRPTGLEQRHSLRKPLIGGFSIKIDIITEHNIFDVHVDIQFS